MIADTGTTTNILDPKAFNEIKKKNPSLHLICNHQHTKYMQSLGNLKDIPCCKQGRWVITIGYSTATQLDIVKMNVHVVTQSSSTSYTDPREDHKQFGNEKPEIPKKHQPDSPIMSTP
jgi:hypothetical protein